MESGRSCESEAAKNDNFQIRFHYFYSKDRRPAGAGSFPAFMRIAGTVHSLSVMSISAHRAPRTSPDLAAVRMANLVATAATPSHRSRNALNAGISDHGNAGWFWTGAILLGLARRLVQAGTIAAIAGLAERLDQYGVDVESALYGRVIALGQRWQQVPFHGSMEREMPGL